MSTATPPKIYLYCHMTLNPNSFILGVSPGWYAAVMGIGITGILLHEFPYHAHWLQILGIIFWAASIAVFVVATVALIARFIMFPKQFVAMTTHIGQSMFLGCMPMAFATITNMVYYIWGSAGWKAFFSMWVIDVAMSLASAWILIYVMITAQPRDTLQKVNATILLPVVALVVAGSTGGLICNGLPAHMQRTVATISVMLWANGQAVAFAFTAIYLHRLLLGKLPPRQIMITNFLPIGPLGQGAFGVAQFSRLDILSDHAKIYRDLGTVLSLCMVGYGTFWLFFACLAVARNFPKHFHMSFWGSTFPVGTYVSACYKLGDDLPAFKPIGCAFCVFLLICVLGCMAGSIYHFPLLLKQTMEETAFPLSDSEIKQEHPKISPTNTAFV